LRRVSKRLGILLAGGAGSRLHPVTWGVSKQLLPVYDKPMVYYPLSLLMLARIDEVVVITTPQDAAAFSRLLGDGSDLGMKFHFVEQAKPNGIAEALLLAEPFAKGRGTALVLGDNLFYGGGLIAAIERASDREAGATVFAYHVTSPEAYGVLSLDPSGRILDIVEKPKVAPSPWAVTGLYFYDSEAPALARLQQPSPRGELEITDLNRSYLANNKLSVEMLGRGTAWLDTGSPDLILQASQFIQAIEVRQGLKVACLEEIAWRNGWIDQQAVDARVARLGKTPYADYLRKLSHETLGA
jgi:glucose-1-phosphate thymidylyltransferase